jgi:hypothetical protein
MWRGWPILRRVPSGNTHDERWLNSYGQWCDADLYGDHFPTEEEASDAVEADWEYHKDELEAKYDDDEEEENEEPSLRHTACFADIQNESIRQERMLEASGVWRLDDEE